MGLDLFPGGLEPSRLLAVDDVGSRLYGRDLDAACAAISRAMGRERALVFLLCQNDPGTLLGYLGCLRCGAVPLALSSHIAPALLRELAETYHPGFYCIPKDLPAETRAVLPNTAPLLELRGSVLIPGGGAERYPPGAGASAYDLGQHRQPKAGAAERKEFSFQRRLYCPIPGPGR